MRFDEGVSNVIWIYFQCLGKFCIILNFNQIDPTFAHFRSQQINLLFAKKIQINDEKYPYKQSRIQQFIFVQICFDLYQND